MVGQTARAERNRTPRNKPKSLKPRFTGLFVCLMYNGKPVARVGGAATGSDTLGGLLCFFGVHQKPKPGRVMGEAHHAHNFTGLVDNRAATASLVNSGVYLDQVAASPQNFVVPGRGQP